jgi:class 3 adenylate cyclase
MTMPNDQLTTVNKLVVVFDICSSTVILEDLLRTNSERYWRDLLLLVKEHLRQKQARCGFELYKFLGDGWILLFDPERKKESVEHVVPVMQELIRFFEREYVKLVRDRLEKRPAVEGLTFGIDRGRLIRMKMNHSIEHVGRPINIAARLQGAVQDKDKTPQGKALMTNSLFTDFKPFTKGLTSTSVERDLRNLAVPKVKCWKITLSASKAK